MDRELDQQAGLVGLVFKRNVNCVCVRCEDDSNR